MAMWTFGLVDVPFRAQFFAPEAPPLTLYGLAAPPSPGFDGGPNHPAHFDKVLREIKTE